MKMEAVLAVALLATVAVPASAHSDGDFDDNAVVYVDVGGPPPFVVGGSESDYCSTADGNVCVGVWLAPDRCVGTTHDAGPAQVHHHCARGGVSV